MHLIYHLNNFIIVLVWLLLVSPIFPNEIKHLIDKTVIFVIFIRSIFTCDANDLKSYIYVVNIFLVNLIGHFYSQKYFVIRKHARLQKINMEYSEREVIRENLPKLVEDTKCSDIFLSIFLSRNTLSKQDIEEINAQVTPNEISS